MTCTGCGGCCSNILPLTQKEIKTIRRYVKKHKIKAVPSVGMMDCPFCDNMKAKDKCLIYEVRPEICRGFYCDGEIKVRSVSLRRMEPIVMREVFYGNGTR